MANINSLDDILNSDTFGLLDDKNEEDIHTLINVPKKIEMPDTKAKGKPCKDFENFEYLFKQIHSDLNNGIRTMVPFANEQDITQGSFFVLKGVMVYIEHKGKLEIKRGKKNTRLRVIFENGTESNLLMRSLSRELYRDGRRISESNESILDKFPKVTEDDKQNGYIYILESLSNEDVIATKKNLYKIGFSTTAVETRIKNAPQDPTYLMAEVKTVAAYEVYNVNPHKLEQLIHRFFGNNCLDIDIIDAKGNLYRPREWFIAPLEVIEEAISLIVSGEIINYRYDEINEKICLR